LATFPRAWPQLGVAAEWLICSTTNVSPGENLHYGLDFARLLDWLIAVNAAGQFAASRKWRRKFGMAGTTERLGRGARHGIVRAGPDADECLPALRDGQHMGRQASGMKPVAVSTFFR